MSGQVFCYNLLVWEKRGIWVFGFNGVIRLHWAAFRNRGGEVELSLLHVEAPSVSCVQAWREGWGRSGLKAVAPLVAVDGTPLGWSNVGCFVRQGI